MDKEVILTGLRSNAEFHLGNYLGAILPMVELQKKHAGKYQLNMFVPDLHSFTSPVERVSLHEQGLRNLSAYVAAGVDINQPDTYIYRQSYIPAHSEMAWILGGVSYFGELSRMTQFKEKSGLTEAQVDSIVDSINMRMDHDGVWDQIASANTAEEQKRLLDIATRPFLDEIRSTVHQKGDNANANLFMYPVLMAADILLYGAKWIPVGEDQRQHIELTRNIAIRFNNKFGHTFEVPHEWNKQIEFVGLKQGARIRSLRSPGRKMSKSIEDLAGTIILSDTPDEAAAKVMSATTDSEGEIHYNWQKQPGVSNLLQILSLIKDEPQEATNSQWEGKTNYSELKQAVADAVKLFLSDFQHKLSSVKREDLLTKLSDDEIAMGKVANQTLQKAQTAVGLRPSQ